MKKIFAAGAILLLPAAILCGCSGNAGLTFNANWYRNTALGDSISETSEHLEYKVTYRAPETTGNLSVEYDEGTYTTDLVSIPYTFSDGSTDLVYRYTTLCTITGKYVLNGVKGETFENKTQTETLFRSVKHQLRPIEGKQEVTSTSHVADPQTTATDLKQVVATYKYKTETKYADDLSSAEYTYTDLTAEKIEPVVKTLDTKVNGTYLDNDEVLFAIRGLNLSGSFTAYTYNVSTGKVESFSGTDPTATTVELTGVTVGEETSDLKIEAYSVTFGYANLWPGPSKKLYYAKTIANDNTYRNALLVMESPLYYSMGTLVYSLKSATFTNK